MRLWNDALAKLLEYFGEETRIDQVSPGQADAWLQRLVNRGLAPTTISKILKRAKQFFRVAHRQELISRDPFADLKPTGERNPDRQHFVDRDVIERVLEAAPDAEWRLLIALVRYGGLRNPSETLKLEWSHIGLGVHADDRHQSQDPPSRQRVPGRAAFPRARSVLDGCL